MEGGYSRKDEGVQNFEGSKGSHENGDEKKLQLRLGPPGVEDWSGVQLGF